MTTSFLDHLEWRFATKAFQTERDVSPEDLKKILKAIRFAPTSFGLQPFHVYVIKDTEIRKKIQEASWGQPQITSSSYLLVFCSRNDTAETRIDEYLEMASGGDAEKKKSMAPYGDMMRGSFQGKSPEEQKIWADRQAYIALGFGLAACAELEIDSCPMEGFDPKKVDEILSLPSSMRSVVYLTVGYRATGPDRPKVRFSEDDLFTLV